MEAFIGWTLLGIFIPPTWGAMTSAQKADEICKLAEPFFQKFHCAEAEIKIVDVEPLIKIYINCRKHRI